MRATWKVIGIPRRQIASCSHGDTVEGEEHRGISRRITRSAMVGRVRYQASAMLYRLGNRAICPEKGVQTVDIGC